jgi:uncharacterized protein
MIERRFAKGAEVRATGSAEKPGITGYAAVFNQEYVLYDSPTLRIVETIAPGTFSRTVDEKQDVRCLLNHDANNLLGRTANSTLRLAEDTHGLRFDNDLDPRTTIAQNVRCFVDRKDITCCSFSFQVTEQERVEEELDGKLTIRRTIKKVDTFDVGPVTFPAYEGTDVKARAVELRAAGFPSRVLALVRDEDGAEEPEEACRCRCRACYSGDCDECDMHMQRCGDQSFCDHQSARSVRTQRGDDPSTKRVDAEDLTAGCFIYVGDPAKPETWALPWKFKTEAKIKSHLANALARFNQTQKIPAEKKAAAWKKLVGLCNKHGVHVSEEESKSMNLSAQQRVDVVSGGEMPDGSDEDDHQSGASVGCGCDCEGCSDCRHKRSKPISVELARARTRAAEFSIE